MFHEGRDYTPGLFISVHSVSSVKQTLNKQLLPTLEMKRLKLSGFNDLPKVTWLDCGSQEINPGHLVECIF